MATLALLQRTAPRACDYLRHPWQQHRYSAATNLLMNTTSTVGVYKPDDGTDYNTALVALTNTAGTSITGTIGVGDTVAGSIVIQDGAGAAETFIMGGTGATQTVGTTTTFRATRWPT